jgi:acetyltransferase-like isoleucine patch superfamily enzyme/O-antigen/teichoic acid export membrane protein
MLTSGKLRYAVTLGASVLQALLSSITALVATRYLGAGQRGLVVIGMTIGTVFGLIAGSGTGSAYRLLLPTRRHGGRHSLAAAFTWCSLLGALAVVPASVLVTEVSAPMIDAGLGTRYFLFATAVYTVAAVALTQVVEARFADGQFRRGGIAGGTMALGGLIGVLLALSHDRSAALALFGQGAGILIGAAYEVRALRRDGLAHFGRPDPGEMSALWRRGAPALGLTVGSALAFRADRYVLGAFAGPAAVGVYSLAATFGEVPRLLYTAVAQWFQRQAALGRRHAPLGKAIVLACGIAAVVSLPIAVAGWVLMVPVFGAEFASGRSLLLVLLIAEILFAPYLVAARGLLGRGWIRTAGTLGLASSGVSLICYAISAKADGAMGLALGSGVLYFGLSAVSIALFRSRSASDPALSNDLPTVSGGLAMFKRAYQWARRTYLMKTDAVAAARAMGVKVGEGSRILAMTPATFGAEPYLVTIGNDVSIAKGAQFFTHDGGVWIFRKEFPHIDIMGPIVIGNNVLVGVDSMIMPGVTVGDNVVIGARAMVTRDVPSNSVVVGQPARVIMTADEYREKALRVAVHIPPARKREYLKQTYGR